MNEYNKEKESVPGIAYTIEEGLECFWNVDCREVNDSFEHFRNGTTENVVVPMLIRRPNFTIRWDESINPEWTKMKPNAYRRRRRGYGRGRRNNNMKSGYRGRNRFIEQERSDSYDIPSRKNESNFNDCRRSGQTRWDRFEHWLDEIVDKSNRNPFIFIKKNESQQRKEVYDTKRRKESSPITPSEEEKKSESDETVGKTKKKPSVTSVRHFSVISDGDKSDSEEFVMLSNKSIYGTKKKDDNSDKFVMLTEETMKKGGCDNNDYDSDEFVMLTEETVFGRKKSKNHSRNEETWKGFRKFDLNSSMSSEEEDVFELYKK